MTESTAVTTTESVGVLPASLRAAIEHRKLLNTAASEMAKLSWGASLDHQTRRAIADYAHRHNIDPQSEIDILGGKVYLNGKYYLRQLSYLVREGVVEYAMPDFIHVDPRLNALAGEGDGWAKQELTRRVRERILHDVDEAALSACVFRIKLRQMPQEIMGCKAIYEDKTREGKLRDPIGNASPAETVETRAARRAMRYLASHMPERLQEIVVAEGEAEVLSTTVHAGLDRAEASLARTGTEDARPVVAIGGGAIVRAAGGGTPLAQVSSADPYGVDDDESRRNLAFDRELVEREGA